MSLTYPDIMLDLETLGTSNDAAIIQIGAVAFNVNGDNAALWTNSPDALASMDQGIRININLERSESPGVLDAGSVMWWLQQSQEARDSITHPGPMQSQTLKAALQTLTNWMNRVMRGRGRDLRLWSNGPTFDEVIIRSAYKRNGLEMPISFRGSRCCRTMFALARDLGWNPKEAAREAPNDIVKHDGLGDAVFQARSLTSQLAYIRSLGNIDVGTSPATIAKTSSGPGEVT